MVSVLVMPLKCCISSYRWLAVWETKPPVLPWRPDTYRGYSQAVLPHTPACLHRQMCSYCYNWRNLHPQLRLHRQPRVKLAIKFTENCWWFFKNFFLSFLFHFFHFLFFAKKKWKCVWPAHNSFGLSYLREGVWLMPESQAPSQSTWLAPQRTCFSSSWRPSGSRVLPVAW